MQALHFAGQLHTVDHQVDPPRRADRIPGIEHHVQQYHLQLPGIHFNRRQPCPDLFDQFDIGRQRVFRQRANGPGHLGRRNPCDAQLPIAGKAEQLLGQLGAPLPGIENVLEHTPGAAGVVTVDGQAGGAEDDGQQVVEVVGQAAGQLAEGLEFLRLEQLGAHGVQLQRGIPAIGDVARDLGQADDLALLVANDVHRGQGPELRAILAYAPALILRHSLLQGLAQQAFGAAVGTIFGGEEQGEMLADHLVGAIALDPLGTGVPRHHMAIWVEHVDGIVHHRLNQLFIARFGHH